MALLACESFDGVETIEQLLALNNNEGVLKWTSPLDQFGGIGLVVGRTGRGINMTAPRARLMFDADRARVFIGAAFFMPASANKENLYLFGVGQTNTTPTGSASNWGAYARTDTSRRLNVVRRTNTTTTVLTTTSDTNVYPLDEWFYLEFECLCGDPGEARLRVNELMVAEVDGVRTQPLTTEPASWNRVEFEFQGQADAPGFTVDDLYAVDDIGSVANTFLGDQIVECIFPNDNGDLNEWMNSNGNSVNNWSYVNERDIDDTTYNESTVAGNRDLYGFQDLAADFGDLAGVQVTGRATHLSDADPMNMSLLAREGGSESESSDAVLENAFRTPRRVFLTAPDLSTWTRAKVNAAQFGTRAKAP